MPSPSRSPASTGSSRSASPITPSTSRPPIPTTWIASAPSASPRASRSACAWPRPRRSSTRIDELYQPETVVKLLNDAVGDTDLEMIAEGDDLADLDIGSDKASARPIIRLVDHIIAEGISQRASDIHLELQEEGVEVTLAHRRRAPRRRCCCRAPWAFRSSRASRSCRGSTSPTACGRRTDARASRSTASRRPPRLHAARVDGREGRHPHPRCRRHVLDARWLGLRARRPRRASST